MSFGVVKSKCARDRDLHALFTRAAAARTSRTLRPVRHAGRHAPRLTGVNPGRPLPDLSRLLDLLVADPGRPRLTWYGDDGERVELSGAVLANWVAKTVNLLVSELDAGPGSIVVVDLPPHWRSVTWTLAAWRAGATVVVPPTEAGPDEGPDDGLARRADVVVTSRPGSWSVARDRGADLVAVALPALARRFDGELPAGAIDAAAAVMTYGDAIGWAPPTEPDETALESPDGAVTFADLLGPWVGDREQEPRARVLVAGDRSAAAVLHDLLAAWSADGSVVLASAATAAELRDDTARQDRVRDTERVTAGAL